MGFNNIEFNWGLKLRPENGYVENIITGNIYSFSKSGKRIFPIDHPIDLLTTHWEAVAKVMVTEFLINGDNTVGKYKVIRVYTDIERSFLTKYWRETIDCLKGGGQDFSQDIKAS